MKRNFVSGYVRRVSRIAVVVLALCLIVSSFPGLAKVKAAATPITVYATDALPQTFYGYGAQFDPYIGSDRVIDPLTTAQWNTVLSRAD
ncbi:hypothetical protein [Paenibacillus glycanilyticus]|uniref:Uncharacterized protein n=1 Tax=Paenibacillus glycanilyticus TaxID=126569 RepID=A0ABQ6GEI6_9BACL|nr:hypothetical protein [Paenibacillus glycanilyticus]GLX68648.1 hypothetical protein MU1_29930 [Paenibacillus glycanilyticus]